MAILKTDQGEVVRDFAKVAQLLEPLKVTVRQWPVGDSAKTQALLRQDVLNAEEGESLLKTLDHYFEQLQQELGYQSRDLIALHPATPNLETLLTKFDKCHTHDDDEVRYVIDGEGTFGFVYPDGRQVALTIQAGEYINVPKDTEHWFVLTDKRRIKCVRYFTGKDGWVANYTGTDLKV